MHDMWPALIAAAFGHIRYIAEPTLFYRQHGGNETGARKPRNKNAGAAIRKTMLANSLQAKLFVETLRG